MTAFHSTFERALAAHIARIEAENACERFQSAPDGTLAGFYTRENFRKSITEPGWARIWLKRDGDSIIAHASAYFSPFGPDIAHGHISVERDYRGQRIAAALQAARGAWLDCNGLALIGAVAPGNAASLVGCMRSGFEVLDYEDPTGATWVVRRPRGQDVVPR